MPLLLYPLGYSLLLIRGATTGLTRTRFGLTTATDPQGVKIAVIRMKIAESRSPSSVLTESESRGITSSYTKAKRRSESRALPQSNEA